MFFFKQRSIGLKSQIILLKKERRYDAIASHRNCEASAEVNEKARLNGLLINRLIEKFDRCFN